MTLHEMTSLWANHFDSEFPALSFTFWRKYDPAIANAAFDVTAKRALKRPFANMADATRFATRTMNRLTRTRDLVNIPGPTPKTVSNREGRRQRFIIECPEYAGKTNAEIDAAIQATVPRSDAASTGR